MLGEPAVTFINYQVYLYGYGVMEAVHRAAEVPVMMP